MNQSILELIKELFVYDIRVVSEDNYLFFKRLEQELPFKISKYQSGLVFNGWMVPKLWKVKKALILKEDKIIFDGAVHPLAVALYSKSFKGEIDLNELKKHLVTNPELPQAYVYHCKWQYTPWNVDWMFCMPYEIFSKLTEGVYKISLETTYEEGEMLVAEYEHKGKSDNVVVFNAHTCHPKQANDDLAGVALLVRLFQWLKNKETHYTYKLILGPEHLGTVFYLSNKTKEEINKFMCGVFAEMPGTKGPITVASSFLGGQLIDKAFSNAVSHYSVDHKFVPWREGAGNDETVWEAPGYEIPFVEVSRAISFSNPYLEYHTSLDTPDLMDEKKLNEFLFVFQQVIGTIENNAFIYRKFDGLLCLSNPEYNLYFERPDPSIVKKHDEETEKWGHLLDSLFRYFDGSLTILDIAEKHKLPFDKLYNYLIKFKEKGLVNFVFSKIERPPISKKSGD